MPTALAGSHGAKAYGASSGVVADEFFWAVTMARSHGAAVPLPLRMIPSEYAAAPPESAAAAKEDKVKKIMFSMCVWI
ncbi:hypothetical protein Tco_1196766 [Tanacetum coccineum]